MDILSDLLHHARARDAVVRRLVQRPPWALVFADDTPLALLAPLGGPAWVAREGRPPVALAAGDVALVRGDTGADAYTVSDDPGTPPQAVIRGGRKRVLDAAAPAHRPLSPRTYGDGLPGATTMIRGAYRLRGDAGDRLLTMLPPLAVVPAGPRTGAALALLADEVGHDEPGQDAVLGRLLDLLLVLALRQWCARPDAAPGWHRALGDGPVGAALRMMHEAPARRWTVAALARETGLSRAAFAARFAALVGTPPLTYLTGWRMTLAADLLRDTDTTVASVARTVGYDDPFAFSAAFKRLRGASPRAWRRAQAP